jgi:nucleoside-diphosphate-sugar epimerase
MVRKVVIEGTAAVFDACAKVDSIKSVVNAGSSSEYGIKSTAMHEEMRLEPNTIYGCAKTWATLYGQYLTHEKKVPITTLRLFSVFGPWEVPPRFMPSVILSCLRGIPPKLSNLQTVRDFVFVDDVVSALLTAADNPCPGEVINIGFGRQMTLKEAADIIIEHTGAKKIKIETGIVGRNFDRKNICWQADISKAKKLLGWRPKYSQEKGIIKTIKWFYENQKFYPTK